MVANEVDIAQGENQTLQLTVVDSAGAVYDLTGATVTFTVKIKATESANLIQKDSNTITEVDITNPTGGIAQIFLLPVDTATTDPAEYVYDVWVEDSTGDQFQAVEATRFRILKRVTVL